MPLKYKILGIKAAILVALGIFLSTDAGKPYAEMVKPVIESILNQDQ